MGGTSCRNALQMTPTNARLHSQTRLIVDREGVVIAVLGGIPTGDAWLSVQAAAANAIKEAAQVIKFSTKHLDHRRSQFPALAAGVSHGGSQQQPSVLNNSTNAQAIERLFKTPALCRISGHTNCKATPPQ